MSYQLRFTRKSQQDIDFHKKMGDRATLRKLLYLLEEIAEHSPGRKRQA